MRRLAIGKNSITTPPKNNAGANAKFRRRFGSMEKALAATDRSLADLDLKALDDAWNTAKKADRE